MEQLSSPEQAYLPKAKQFISENSPSPEDFPAYHAERIEQYNNGERVWIVRGVHMPHRVFDLYDGEKQGGVVASILLDGDPADLGSFECIVYGQSDEQESFAEDMLQVRRWLGSRGREWQESEELFLGMALTKIDELIA
jgi:hypothetical protein